MIYVGEIEALGGAPDTPPGKGYAFFEMSTG